MPFDVPPSARFAFNEALPKGWFLVVTGERAKGIGGSQYQNGV